MLKFSPWLRKRHTALSPAQRMLGDWLDTHRAASGNSGCKATTDILATGLEIHFFLLEEGQRCKTHKPLPCG